MDDERKSPREIAEELIREFMEGRSTASADEDSSRALTWEERTEGQRFADKMKTHGYPPGLAKSAVWKRDDLVAVDRVERMMCSPEERARRDDAREALAWALDAERFLGSLPGIEPRGGLVRLEPPSVDEIAEHLELWLRERGYELRPIERDRAAG